MNKLMIMKNITTFLLLLFTANSFAQLTIKPTTIGSGVTTDNTYIYVDGTVIYVEENTNFTKNNDTEIANLYLRNEAQLIQGTSGTSNNLGTGTMSVFQEGTADAFEYNYWGSPVGVLTRTDPAGNTPFGVASLGAPINRLKSNATLASNGYNGTANPFRIAQYWIWKYINTGTATYADWIHVQFNQTINAGEGFTMKGTNGTDNTIVHGVQNNPGDAQRYDFRGRPNDGTITVTTATDYDEIILIGNPYPSALNLNYFLIENSKNADASTTEFVDNTCTDGALVERRNSTTGVAYFWDMDDTVNSHNIKDYKGGYGAYAPNAGCTAIGTYTPPVFYMYDVNGNILNGSAAPQTAGSDQYRRFLPIGQGFFVDAPDLDTGDSPIDYPIEAIQFKNTHRVFVKEGVSNESYFDRSSTVNNSNNDLNEKAVNYVLPKLRLNIEFDGLYTRQLALAFNDDASSDIEVGMDALNFDSISSDAGFLHGTNSYVIDTRPFDIDDRLPLYLNLSSQNSLSFKVNNFENFYAKNVFIYDKQTDIYHSVKNNYFYITLPAGNYSERFELTFKDSEEDLEASEEIASSFDVIQNNTNAQLTILNPLQENLKSVEVFDMTGKRVLFQRNLGNRGQYYFSTSQLAESVYVVKISTTDNITTTKKISVFQRR